MKIILRLSILPVDVLSIYLCTLELLSITTLLILKLPEFVTNADSDSEVTPVQLFPVKSPSELIPIFCIDNDKPSPTVIPPLPPILIPYPAPSIAKSPDNIPIELPASTEYVAISLAISSLAVNK